MTVSNPDKKIYSHKNASFSSKHHKRKTTGFISSDQVYIVCSNNHTWDLPYASLKKGVRCPYCSGSRAIPGVNDAVAVHPWLEDMWDEKENGGEIPRNLKSGSHKKFHWKCPKGHQYVRPIRDQVRLSGKCPYCSGHYAIPGETDLATVHPRVLDYWDPELNDIDITSLLPQSNKKVVFRCPEYSDHIWTSSVQSFVVNDVLCPYCSNKRVLAGFNDVATTDPDIAAMWSKNNTVLPTEVTHGAADRINWVCDLGHEWSAKINNVYSSGSRCPVCVNAKVLPGYNDLATVAPHILDKWDFKRNVVNPREIVYKSNLDIHWVCSSGHEEHRWVASPKERFYGKALCPVCSWGISKGEKQLFDFVQGVLGKDVEAVSSVRSIIPPQELDIYIPSLKIAIEYNGLYWHSEAIENKGRQYHRDKWQKCKDQGIQLITIWEDQWRDNQDLVKNMLTHKLGVSRGPRVFARKTTVAKVDNRTAREFCDKYHIQGFAPGSTYLGLEDSEGNLVALSIWRKNKTDLYLDRYCTSVSVIGGMGKLLKAGKQFARENNLSQIITFADHDVSDGGLYEKLGFANSGELNPDYKYLVNGERKHKFGYRLKRFKSDPELLYEEGLTETQLAKLNGLERIWDSGKTRYTMEV